jgi:hypothetical protein
LERSWPPPARMNAAHDIAFRHFGPTPSKLLVEPRAPRPPEDPAAPCLGTISGSRNGRRQAPAAAALGRRPRYGKGPATGGTTPEISPPLLGTIAQHCKGLPAQKGWLAD